MEVTPLSTKFSPFYMGGLVTPLTQKLIVESQTWTIVFTMIYG